MAPKITLTRYLVEEQRIGGCIPAQLRLLLEVVARACKSISLAVNKGDLGDVMGTADSENVQGEKARHHRQRSINRGQRMGRPPCGHGQRGNGRHLRGAQPLSPG